MKRPIHSRVQPAHLMNFLDALHHTIDLWRHPDNEDEWLWANFRASHITPMSAHDAFCTLDDVIHLLLKETDEPIALALLDILIALARHSDTTEMPTQMATHQQQLYKHSALNNHYAQNQLTTLFRHYRRQ